jgi:GTP-binding protein Era
LPDVPFRCGFVALIGRPNVGKSTLLNTLVGAKVAIVAPKPQTTRTRVVGIKTLGQAQLIFVDTPGLHRPTRSLLNRRMVETAMGVWHDTDVLVLVADARQGITPADEEIISRLSGVPTPLLVALNKIDLVARPALLPLLERLATLLPARDIIPVSARSGENTQELLKTLMAALPISPPLYPHDELTDQSERVFAQEIVREQLFLLTEQEVPYAAAVRVEEFTEQPAASLLIIRAVIYVERPSQRAIILGARGSRLKQVGQAARLRLEEFFACRVFLELFVKVAKGWTNNPLMLKMLGL